MDFKKMGFTMVALLLLLGSMPTQVFAFDGMPEEVQGLLTNDYTITPFWLNITDVFPAISSSGTTLYPEVYVEAKSSSAKITGTMYLEKYSSGKWVNVTSWSISGTGYASVSKSYSGTSGTEYRTRVVVNVNSERVEVSSNSCRV